MSKKSKDRRAGQKHVQQTTFAQKMRAEQRVKMAEKEHLAYLDDKIAAIRGEIGNIDQKYGVYHREVQESLIDLLKSAGVYDEFHALETERQGVLEKAQGRVKALDDELKDLLRLREVLAKQFSPSKSEPSEDFIPAPKSPETVVVEEVVEVASEVASALEVTTKSEPELPLEPIPEVLTAEVVNEVQSIAVPLPTAVEKSAVELVQPRRRPAPPAI